MSKVIQFISNHYKSLLIGGALLLLVWAFAPSWATRTANRLEQEKQQLVESAKQHEGRANAAEEAAHKEAKDRIQAQAERDAIAKDKAILTSRLALLQKQISPRPTDVSTEPRAAGPRIAFKPPVGDAGMGETERAQWSLAVDTRDAALAAANELIAKHEGDDAKEAAFIASLNSSVKNLQTALAEQKLRGDDYERALRAKELQVMALKSANASAGWKGRFQGAAAGFVAGLAFGMHK